MPLGIDVRAPVTLVDVSPTTRRPSGSSAPGFRGSARVPGPYGRAPADRYGDGPDRPIRRRPRPRWGRIVLVIGAFLLIAALLGGGLVALRLSSYDGKLTRTDAFAGVTEDRPVKTADGTQNILIIGSDSRDGTAYNPNDRSSTTATVAGERADSIILAHVPADNSAAYLVSIPRDTYVFIPENPDNGLGGYKNKINAAYAWGGIPLVVQTVEGFTGVRVDNVVKVDFNGFQAMTDALGGVDVTVDKTTTDPRSKRTFTAGVNHLDGAAALDFVRQRYGLPNGDFDRVKRQQIFLRALLSKATSTGTLTNPLKLDRFLSASASTLTVDGDFSLTDLAMRLRTLRPSDLTFVTSPYSGTDTIGGQSVVVPDKKKASALFEAVAQDTVAEWLAANPQKAPTSGR